MQNETRQCQNCKKDFTIESEDFKFYEKIKVPAPTFCPECRLVRRMLVTNERVLYKRKCDLTGKDIFSMYDENVPYPVYDTDAWYSDKWDAYQYGMDVDFSKPFFEQILELQNKVPRMALVKQGFSINSPYTHRINDSKNCYMVFRATRPENSFYSYVCNPIKDCSDCGWVDNSELCYECLICRYCYNVRFSQDSINCRDSSFLYACRNCSNCVGCVNLVNQEYYIFNQPFGKDEYFKKIKELKLNSVSGIEKMKSEFEIFRKKFPQKSIASIKSEKVSGNWFTNTKNVNKSFNCVNVKDGKYLFSVFNAEDCMDYFEWGNNAELIYEAENCGINISRIFFSGHCWMSASDLYYCNTCPSAHDCFGCVGLNKGEYSILNKKYSKENYEILKEKIIKHMTDMPYVDERGIIYKFGEHFPNSFSDFAYNEGAAADFFPLTKEEVLSRGYRWKEKEKKNYDTTLKSSDLPETIGEVGDSILDEIIECSENGSQYSVGAFRVTNNELAFYRRMDLPIPRACFDIRHMHRINKLPFFKSYQRKCDKCGIDVETPYDANYAPIIYCETCYQQEVY
ncbi:hypothetical protein COU49_00040 [Candidatus Nomurabacteria bacterium CG10_big_fil_rev_8_21_14_0_10_35_16]|uniref:Uncharacterized protein n=1 Tax=Candidatus Nomurabacteria bacterium CG10_big_fil_rev_8_21_14_0_10_35_16 TaxID=1974731 RepID=A0A2H0TC72_9BACT|nr:MAG: hypothetical protein COU49_00040 [Candidatus Nomurabacteria bacterium CG10_big_fil_rev_8_21_14_0_10_35_16]